MAYVLFSAIIVCTFLVYGIKAAIFRPRPYVVLELFETNILTTKDPYSSFPSSHTASAFTTAAILGYYFKKWIIPVFAAAVCAGLARIYLLVHYPSDVVAGAIIGILVSLCVIYISRQVMKRQKEK